MGLRRLLPHIKVLSLTKAIVGHYLTRSFGVMRSSYTWCPACGIFGLPSLILELARNTTFATV